MTGMPRLGLGARWIVGAAGAAGMAGAGAILIAWRVFGDRASVGTGLGVPAALAFAGLLCGLAVARLLRRDVARSIDRLVEGARRWASGDLAYRVDPAAPEDFRRLTDALNQMAASLRLRDERIHLGARERLMQTDKLATIGQLAAGVAHEINNPLGGILMYGNLVLETTPEGDPRRENLRKIIAQATRARGIVRGLLDFSRLTPPKIERVDVNRVVGESLELLERHPLFRNVQVRTELSTEPLWVRIDLPRMQQVFINIIVNALEAMPGGGILTIRVGLSERAGYCRVAISDTGAGIAEEQIGRIFEPFFTTKEVGHGVGLGLAISYGIVRQHSGEIDVQSVPGAGATFRVLLPVEREIHRGD